MDRGRWLAGLVLVLLGVGVAVRLVRPSPEARLPCAPEAVRVDAQGVARCVGPGEAGPGGRLGAEATLGLGGRLDLNTARADELARVPGVGERLARTLVEARQARGGFRSWAEVDAVPGVGATRLRTLQAHTEIR